jgi:hypothetical protein
MSKAIDNGRRQKFVAIQRGLTKLFKQHGVDDDFKIPDYILARMVMRQLKTLMDLNHDLYEHNTEGAKE